MKYLTFWVDEPGFEWVLWVQYNTNIVLINIDKTYLIWQKRYSLFTWCTYLYIPMLALKGALLCDTQSLK